MPPIQDPRFSKARWNETLQEQREASERTGRKEYIKPLVMLGVCAPIALGLFVRLAWSNPEVSAAAFAVVYPIGLGVSVAVGILALFIASQLILGGAGPLGLATLRIAGACAAHDVAYLLLGGRVGLTAFPFLTAVFIFVGLVVWLFEMDLSDAALVAIIILVLKLLVWVALVFLAF